MVGLLVDVPGEEVSLTPLRTDGLDPDPSTRQSGRWVPGFKGKRILRKKVSESHPGIRGSSVRRHGTPVNRHQPSERKSLLSLRRSETTHYESLRTVTPLWDRGYLLTVPISHPDHAISLHPGYGLVNCLNGPMKNFYT